MLLVLLWKCYIDQRGVYFSIETPDKASKLTEKHPQSAGSSAQSQPMAQSSCTNDVFSTCESEPWGMKETLML